jgi:peptide/nickel transport system permease protein
MLDLVPGDPARLILGRESSEQAIEALRAQLGLDRPLHVRMIEWYTGLLHGDLGTAIFQGRPVTEIIAERLPITANIALISMSIALLLGVPTGVIAAIKQGSVFDWAAMVIALIGLSIPIFITGLVFMLIFGVKLRWFPIGGYVPLSEDPKEFVMHMALPCLTLGLTYASMIARMTRTSMLEVLRTDYLRTARAKGLEPKTVLIRHAFKNALIPVLTITGIEIGDLLGGSPVTETVFNLVGIGRMVAEGVARRDYIIVQGGILTLATGFMLVNLLVDISYAYIDPRIRYE